MKNVSVIGHFAEGIGCFDGQTVKTKTLAKELRKEYGKDNVKCYDTHGKILTLAKAPIMVFGALYNAENIIILPAQNGLRIFAPLAVVFNFFFHRKLHYSVIGGWLPEYLKKHRVVKVVLKLFDNIYVETETMKNKAEEQGFKNITVVPNFKDLRILKPNELVLTEGEPYRFCTFSRVMKEKGIEDAVNAITKINTEAGRIVCTLDIFGQVEEGQTEWFENLERTFPEYIKYKGVIDFDKSTDTLKDYFALLFPTYYKGEGFAGTILDAFAAGIPVIASDWKYNSEIIADFKTGLIYETDESDALESAVLRLIQNTDKLSGMKNNCLEEAYRYLPENAMKILAARLNR